MLPSTPAADGVTTTMAAEYTNKIKGVSEALDSSSNVMSLQEKENLLYTAKQLVEKLEGPEIGIWKVVFGVSNTFCRISHKWQAQMDC